MELLLNLAWLSVAATMVSLWLRSDFGGRADRGRQLIAIVVLIAILFPVISVSDDLLAIQNASEVDNILRRDHLVPSDIHPVQPILTVPAQLLFAALGVGFSRFVTQGYLPVPKPVHPGLASIDNRPPPATA
ncbi:MAG TPA: hypothetical protein VGG85_01690 [Terracidiphilus sp.]|jgi:hypothetical protein